MTDPADMTRLQANYWAPIFAAKSINLARATDFITRFGVSFCDSSSSPILMPKAADYRRFLRHAPNSAPGPDGIPYVCWRAAGDSGGAYDHMFAQPA